MFSFTHDHWLEMMTDCSGVPKEFSTASTEQDNECRLTEEEARGEVESQPPHNSTAASPPGSVDTWSYVESEHSHSQASRREDVVLSALFSLLPVGLSILASV